MVPDTPNLLDQLLPDRHPQADFFICDVADAVLKDLIPQMEHPFYVLSKKPEMAIRRYEHGGESLGFFERNTEPELGGVMGDAFSTVSEWQQTHPLSRVRIARLAAQFEENGWEKSGTITPLPDLIECPNFEPCGL